MNPRRLAGPERLEERIDMNADPITTEYLPTAHGTAEVGSAQWQTILSATHANIIHHFESDQAGEQRHLWSGNFYGWEGIAEFDPSLPEGAVIDGAVLRMLIVNAEDTMNRQPSLVAHLSSQDQAGEIATSEYNNAGVTLGSVPFAQMTPGAYVDIPLDPSFIPTTGAISLSLRTSDQIAGLQPVDSHNSRSVISYSGMKLELRYHVPDTNPEPDIVNDIVLPEELTDLLAEAIVLSRNGPEWRTPETGETQEAILRKGYRLNLRDAEAPVVGIRATVAASNGTTLTAYVYRNTELLRTSQVGTDSAFSYDYEEGFTDVVFTTTNDSTVTVSNLTINTDESLETIAGETIDPFSSKPLGIAAAPAVPLPTSISYVAGKLKFYNTSTIGGESRRYIVRDPSQYTLIRAMMSAGSGKISMIGTIRKDGVDYMGREYGSTSGFPDGYARWISENAVVIAPGAPAPISFIVGAYGSKGSIIVSEAGSLETLLPPATMTAATVNSDLMKMNDQFETPGIFAPYSEIREGSSPTFSRPGDIANVQYHIRNEALAGGQVTARVYVGWYSGEPTRGTLQQTETFSMAGGQTVRLSANVSAPAKPDDATSERPIISVVLTMPDGTTVQNTKLGKEPKSHEKIVKTVNGLMRIESQEYTRREQARIHALTDRALNALLSSSDKRLVAARTVLGDDHIVELIAKNTAAALALGDETTQEDSADMAVATMETITSDQINPAYIAANGEFVYDPFRGSEPSGSFISPISSHLPRRKIDIGQSDIHPALHLNLSKLQSAKIPFDLSENKMVNFSVEANQVGLYATDIRSLPAIVPPGMKGNIRMVLTGTTNEGHSVTWSTTTGAGSGESMSGKLTAGSYQLEIFDDTDYSSSLSFLEGKTIGLKAIPLNFSIVPHNSANIEGRVSIEGSPKVMPVSMRVAEFISDGNGGLKRNENYQTVSKLNSDMPVWVVAHGRLSSEESSQILEVTRNLRNLDVQVVTLDWHEGAKDNDIPAIGLEGSKWIEKTGAWAANQLRAMGFSGENINVIGHSWGSYVSYEIGMHIPGGVKTIVALDPAADTPILGGGKYKGFNDVNFSFANIASNSYAFHSSDLSNEHFALSAEYSFDIVAPEAYEAGGIYEDRSEFLAWMYENSIEPSLVDKVTDALREHSFAIDVFSGLLIRQKADPLNISGSLFTPEKLCSNDDEFMKRNGWEGVFYVDPMRYQITVGTEIGKTVWKANVFGFVSKDKYGNYIIDPRQL